MTFYFTENQSQQHIPAANTFTRSNRNHLSNCDKLVKNPALHGPLCVCEHLMSVAQGHYYP